MTGGGGTSPTYQSGQTSYLLRCTPAACQTPATSYARGPPGQRAAPTYLLQCGWRTASAASPLPGGGDGQAGRRLTTTWDLPHGGGQPATGGTCAAAAGNGGWRAAIFMTPLRLRPHCAPPRTPDTSVCRRASREEHRAGGHCLSGHLAFGRLGRTWDHLIPRRADRRGRQACHRHYYQTDSGPSLGRREEGRDSLLAPLAFLRRLPPAALPVAGRQTSLCYYMCRDIRTVPSTVQRRTF